MITFKAQHILNPAAKKRIFWRNFQLQLQLQIIPKRPDQYDHFQSSIYTKPCSQKQLKIIPKYDNFQDSTYTKPCSQKTDILTKF